MDAIERTVVIPAADVIVHSAARRQILWQRSPLTAGAQDIHQPVDDLTHVYGPLVAATLGWRNNQTDQRPFGISEVAGIAQRAAVIPSAVVVRPHRAGSCESGRTERITTDSHDSRCSQMDTKPDCRHRWRADRRAPRRRQALHADVSSRSSGQ